ncbi:MAG: 2-C-methyl-D-erythritol 4-phosphate cytidylyltransferase [Actinomycetia bacterium]|nr:2-C-methyl-D-erythritol 4-phosphate cytidylyltransferase [Actinomycetes bacterium]
MDVWGIVVAAGRGRRFGGAKQFETLGDRRMVDRAVETALLECDEIVLVLPEGATWEGPAVHTVVAGGTTRSDSVRAGLAAVPDHVAVVVVHDAARPLASPELFEAVIAAIAAGADGAVPGVPVTDTIKRVEGSRVVETVARDTLVAVQTPQAFAASALRAAHAASGDATDDAALVEAAGGRVVVVPGEPHNLKITAPRDLELAITWMDDR